MKIILPYFIILLLVLCRAWRRVVVLVDLSFLKVTFWKSLALFVVFGILSITGFAQTLVFSSTNPAVSDANLVLGSVKQPIYRAVMVASGANGGGANLTQVTFTPGGTFTPSDINKYQFWYSTTDDLSTAITNGPDVTTIPASNNLVTFTVWSPWLANATYYMWITADISASATNSRNLTIAALNTSNFTFSTGTKSGTMYDGGTQTIGSLPQASFNYSTQTGTLGSTYSWIDCSSGSNIVSGDDAQAPIAWPFNFAFYDNTYTTANSLSVSSNGFIRLDGLATTNYSAAGSYTLSATSTELGQIVAMAVYDNKVGDNSGWVRSRVTGSSPNRIFTIEYNNFEIDYDDNRYSEVQVSFYETSNKVVLKLGADNINKNGVDMGIHSGVENYFDKWQEVYSGTNNSWIEYTPLAPPDPPSLPAASWNYGFSSGNLGTTYSWIDCSAGNFVVNGDDAQVQINWPFDFNYYDNTYTTSNTLSVGTNGFIRFDGVASTDYSTAMTYDLTSAATNFGQIIAMALYDGNVSASSWVRSLVTGTAPNRVFTIEYNNYEIDYDDGLYANVQVSFYESTNKIVMKLATDNINKSGVDMGLHSGVDSYYNKWQEVLTGTNNTWIEYVPPYVEINATIGSLSSSYFTLKSAFDKINDGTHRGNITIKINHSTTETAAAVLNASGTGAANYSSVSIYPTAAGLSVSGNLSTPLIDLNGADQVTIDGRANTTGTTKDLTINNTSTSSTAGTSTVRFINDASNNTINYCTIKGSESSAACGIIFFSTTTSSNGSDNNTISNNNITSSVSTNRPINAIYSSGTPGKNNSSNSISTNNIYDFLNRGAASNGILLSANTFEWTIDGNSFYETATFIPTASVSYNAIQISNTSGNGFIVTNNYIGGNSALCGGAAWTKTNAANNAFTAINLNVSTETVCSVQNNTIQNIDWSNSANAVWTAISVAGGDVNIGTVTGNSIGESVSTGSIKITGGTSGQTFYGINVAGIGAIDCQNNSIGSITVANTNAANSGNFYGINRTNTRLNNFSNNTIGSITQANSIQAISASTGNAQSIYGIRNTTGGTIICNNNTIANLYNGTTNTVTGTLGQISGISSNYGINTITNNTIYNLSISNANSASSNAASVSGIAVASTNALNTISGNTIYNLSNTNNTFTGSVIGLYFGSTGMYTTNSHLVTGNFINSLSVTGASVTSASVYGIKINTGQTTYANNIISLSGNTATTIYGIYEYGTSANNNSIYFNTVYINGSLGTGVTNKSYAFYSAVTTNVRNFRNNIFMNARSTTAGVNLHYAAYFNYGVNTSLTVDYNNYYVTGTGGVLGYYGSNKTSLPIITGQDANSLNTDPNFTIPGGTNYADYFTQVSLPGVFGTGITTDYEGITRNSTPKMGALESALGFIWQGTTSTDFATASNWQNGAVPPDGADISFAATPTNHCYLDQNRTLNNITNTSVKKFIVNGKQFTISGNIVSATANQIDASAASSVVIFAGNAPQNIPIGVFVSNTIDALTLNNEHGLAQNGNLTVSAGFTLTSGAYNIGANTLSINGAISTTSGSITGGSTSNIIIGGSGANTALPGISLNNLTINRSNGITLGGNVSVAGTLALTNGTLALGANTLTISGNSPTRTSGNIDASNASASLLFTNTSGITLPASLFNGAIQNLTINGGGITAGSDITVNGVLNLQNVNPSDTKALLDMVINWNDYPGTTNINPGFNNLETYILSMGASATTIGPGDVSGVIKRNTILSNTAYTFGNQFTTVNISDAATVTAVTMTIRVGNLPGHSTTDDAVKRHYEMVPILVDPENVSTTSNVNMNFHYLDSELNGNDEINLTTADYDIDGGLLMPDEHGRADYDFTNNFIGLSNVPLNYFVKNSSHVWRTIFFLREFQEAQRTWNGEESTDWNDPLNWLPFGAGVPTALNYVIIPDATTTTNDPFLPAVPPTINTMTIETGGVLVMGDKTINIQNTMSGGWEDQSGLSDPGTSKVVFLNPGASISGIPVFYDIEIGNEATATNQTNAHVKISGSVTRTGTGKWFTSIYASTVEYNKEGAQTVIIPDGTSNYYSLVLSGSGTKTMPGTALNIIDELKLMGTVTATAASEITIGNELEILEDATFATGNFDHTVGGPFDNRGTFTASAGTNITLNGTTVQEIYGGSPTTFEKLTINNTAGIDVITDITVNDELTLTTGNLNILSTTLTINGTITKTSGFINTAFESSLTFGGTTSFVTAIDLFASPPQIYNLTINRTGGVELGCDITIDGILHLQSANPTDIKGTLDMGTYTMLMGPTAINTGTGDMTGKVKRTTFVSNTEYTFGHPHSSVTFPAIGTLPTEIILKISIGSVPTWKTDGIKRVYDISQVGGSGTRATIKTHYLDSELNGNNELNISFFSYVFPTSTLLDRGLTEINTTENWITLNNTDFGNLPSSFGVIEHGFGVSTSNVITWDGSENTDWFNQYNWTPAYSPDATKRVVIPDASTTPLDPIMLDGSSDIISSISIQAGGILNAGAGTQLSISGAGGAWSCYGTFNASTSKVIFNHGVLSSIVTVAGTTNFYDIEVGANTTLQPVSECFIRIEGTGSADMTNSKVDFSTFDNTVEFNGGNQTIVYPFGIDVNHGFYNLILSGSGTKTMPDTTMKVSGDFTISGTAYAIAADSIIILGNAIIDNGATFATGSHQHFMGGNFVNNGTFTPTSGGTITFNGSSAQTISGSYTTTFDGLSVNNLNGVSILSDVHVNNLLSFLDGNLTVGSNTLGINGTIYKPSGHIEAGSTSSLSFGGTSAITLNNNLFNGHPVINNLTINRSGGVTLGNESITVSGTLTLTSGTLTIDANTLTLKGSAPARSSGNIDVSNASATLAFENAAAITLPAALFSGNVNNMTINGAGGITAGGNYTLNGILNLQCENPSAVKGTLEMSSYTLTMGATSTTIGQGDVSGIIKRSSIVSNTSYSMGNQYTTIYFPNVGTLPTEMSLKVTLGSAPSWRTGAVERVYDFIQTGGSGTEAVLKSHYLDSELNGNDENKLVEWMHIYAYPLTIEYGRSAYNTNENWVSVSHVNVGAFSSVFGVIEMVVDEYELLNLTWNGSTSTSWVTATNWTPQGAPSDETVVTIPDAATTTFDPSIPEIALCGKVVIESGGILNSVDNGQLTVKGADGAWANNGTFAPGKGTVIFANGIEANTVTISGTNNFYDLTVTDKTRIQAATNSTINIEGAFTANTSNCIVDFSSNPNTVGYNGSKQQSVVNPGGTYGYSNLNFSGDGEKVLPVSSLLILGDLSIDATISATGNTLLMAGTSTQNLGGTTGATLDNLTIDNASGVTLTNTALITISGTLLINTAKNFEIAAGKKLSVAGTITNDSGSDGLVLNSDGTGTASLIHNTENVPATVERYISGAAEAWHFLSSPVANQEISGDWLPSGTYGNGTGYDLYAWNEPNNCWIYKLNTTTPINWTTVHPGTDFTVGRGYLYSVQQANPGKEFVGYLNNGSVSYPLTSESEDLSLKGFNLVGNPYPSSIDWVAVSGWSRSGLVSSGSGYDMWIWNPTANNYGVCNSYTGIGTNSVTQYIAPMQGFFVLAENAGSLDMDNMVRVHDGAGNWFKNSVSNTQMMSVIVQSGENKSSDEVQLQFGYKADEKGAEKLFSHVITAPGLYTPGNNKNFSVRYLTDTEENPTVPVNFKPGRDGEYTLHCSFDNSNFEIVMLEDRQMNYLLNLRDKNSYNFLSSATDNPNRFVLHFGPDNNTNIQELPARIYYDGAQLNIDLTLVNIETTILIYDALGRVLMKDELEGLTQHKLSLKAPPQILIVQLRNQQGAINRKVFYQNYH